MAAAPTTPSLIPEQEEHERQHQARGTVHIDDQSTCRGGSRVTGPPQAGTGWARLEGSCLPDRTASASPKLSRPSRCPHGATTAGSSRSETRPRPLGGTVGGVDGQPGARTPFPSPAPRDHFAAPVVSAGEGHNLLAAQGRAIVLERQAARSPSCSRMLRLSTTRPCRTAPPRGVPVECRTGPRDRTSDGWRLPARASPGRPDPRVFISLARRASGGGVGTRSLVCYLACRTRLCGGTVRFCRGPPADPTRPGSCEPDRLGDRHRWDGHGPDGAGPPEPVPDRDQGGRSDAIREHSAPAPEGRNPQLHTDPNHSPRARRRTEFWEAA